MHVRSSRRAILAIATAALLLVAAGCGSGAGSGPVDPASLAPANTLAYASFEIAPQGPERQDFDAALANAIQLRAGALVIGTDVFFFSRSGQLGAMAARHAIPAICPYRDFAAAGGLISYGTNNANQFRQVGVYTSRILKGEKPADLPVQQAVKLDLLINLKTAKALGLTVPLIMQMTADEVIE